MTSNASYPKPDPQHAPKPGPRVCMSCQCEFKSPDAHRIRICPRCKESEVFK